MDAATYYLDQPLSPLPVPAPRPTVVCLTPVKNEAWILDRFLSATEMWADLTVVADQGSTDGSQEVVAGHPKALLIHNSSPRYDEGHRQRLLIDAARARVPGPRVLITLDADEALTADAADPSAWESIFEARPGSTIWMRWLNLLPGATAAWVADSRVCFGIVDDGSEHSGGVIHSTRVPVTEGPRISPSFEVLHLQYLDWPRMKAKQRWYQAFERVEHPAKRPTQLYRQYHRMDAIAPHELTPAEARWWDGYRAGGIDLLAPSSEPDTQWDSAVLGLIADRGAAVFRRVDLWDHDWTSAASREDVELPRDPRSRMDRAVFGWLRRTQGQATRWHVRLLQRALGIVGW